MRKEEFEFIYSEDADLQSLMKDVQNCENDVRFETLEGDRFSLKSGSTLRSNGAGDGRCRLSDIISISEDEHNLRIRKGTRWGRGNGCSFFWNCSTVITNYVIGNTMQSIT